MRALRLATCLLGFALLACGVSNPSGPSTPLGVNGQAIVGGTPSTGDPSVFMLDVKGNNGATTRCSATLIAPSTLLTAAHCLDPAMLGATSLTVVATNVATEAEVIPGVNTVDVIETRLHPLWNGAADLGNDLGLARLATAQPFAPSPWNRESLAGLGGAPVRVLGYGASTPDGGTGSKRVALMTIRQLTPDLISLGDFVSTGICHGDSGGPTFHTFGDGVERLVGVHSFTRADDCLDGADTRVDAKAPFLLEWLAEKDQRCGADFVCALGACAPADPDCVEAGASCEGAWQCPGRECVTDAQHAAAYCSKRCATDGDCPAPLKCDVARSVCQRAQLPSVRAGEPCLPGATFCLNGALCTGDSVDVARCSQPCTRSIECVPGQSCRAGFSGGTACFDPAPITLPAGRLELPAATGCSTGTGELAALALLWLARARRGSCARGT